MIAHIYLNSQPIYIWITDINSPSLLSICQYKMRNIYDQQQRQEQFQVMKQAKNYREQIIVPSHRDKERDEGNSSATKASSPTLKPRTINQMLQIFSDHISLKLLEYLEMQMQPHHKYFNIIEMAEIIDRYIDRYLVKISKPTVTLESIEQIHSTSIPMEIPLARKMSQNKQEVNFQLKKEEYFQILMEQMRLIFLYFAKLKLSYELINEYVYNEQLVILNTNEKDEEYLQIGQKRIHLDDQNIKICLMPLVNVNKQFSPKIVDLIFRENDSGSQLQQIYSVTKQFVRCIKIKPELIGIAADYDKKGGSQSLCWYYYEDELIMPRQSTIDNSISMQKKILVKEDEKMNKFNPKKNIQDIFSPQLLSILKAQIGKCVIGMITLDTSFVIEPILKDIQDKKNQGYIGNLMKDVPPVIAIHANMREKYHQILLFHNYSDHQWLIATQKFLYFYRIPAPSENIILKNQNNSFKSNKYEDNPLLLMCQRMPKGSTKCIVLKRPYVAIMLQRNTILILKVVMNSSGIFQGKKLVLQNNYYTITNKIYNDIQYKCMNYNAGFNYMFLSDFGAYMIRIKFNQMYGDIEEEGIIYNKIENHELNKEVLRNSYSQLKLTKNRIDNGVIYEIDEEEENRSQNFISVTYIKKNNSHKKTNHLISMYKKSNKSPHTIIIKNQNRQLITYITSNSHFNTLITYESQSIEKKTHGQFEGQKFRQWSNKNEIKLWDMKHMTIYQNVKASIEISFLQLRYNGLFAVTSEKGYLAFYPFNEEKKILRDKAEQQELDKESKEVLEQLSDDLVLDNSTLYFSTLISSYNKFNNLKINKTNIYQMQLQKYPITNLIQTLPAEITSMDINSRIYVLENSTKGIDASQVHIYNKLGIKEEVMVFSNHEDIDMSSGKIVKENFNQEYKYLKRIEHEQFQVVLWNSDSYKLVGTTHEQSFTVIFNFSRLQNASQFEKTSHIRNIQINKKLLIIYCQNITKIKDKSLSTVTISSKHSQNSQIRSFDRYRNKVHEQSEYSIIIVNNEIDRINFKLTNISNKIKILHLYHSLLITKEESNNQQLIKILDVAQNGNISDKILFSVKYSKIKEKVVRKQDLKTNQFSDIDQEKNIILQEIKELLIRKTIILEQSKIAISQSNKLIIILIFKLQIQYSDLASKKIIKNQIEFLVYVRNISDELYNYSYKISKFQVDKKNNKNLYEYKAKDHRVENIIGHQKMTYAELSAKSNFMEIDIQKLTQVTSGEQSSKYQVIDITNTILMPHKINNDRIKDIYKIILSLQNDKKLLQLYKKEKNKGNILNSFSFKMIEYNEDLLNGIIAITNKTLRTISLYNFKINCQIQQQVNEIVQEKALHRLNMVMEKISLFQVKSIKEIQEFQRKKIQNIQMHHKKIDHIQLFDWNKKFKSRVDQIWQQTFMKIKMFLRQEKDKKLNVKRMQILPPMQLKNSAMKIKKQQILKRKLTINDRRDNQTKQQEMTRPQGINLMFKKWSINQSIEQQKSIDNRFVSNEAKNVNKYINKILRHDGQKQERINSLICNVQKIKEISKMQKYSPINDKNVHYQETNKWKSIESQSVTERSLSCPIERLDSIIKITQIAKQANLKSYMIQKYNIKTQIGNEANPFNADNYKLTRTETNQSYMEIYDQYNKNSSAVVRMNSRNQARNTQLSKGSNETYNKTELKNQTNYFQEKLQRRIKELSEQKKGSFRYTPVQQKQKSVMLKDQKKKESRMKTLPTSMDNNSQLSKLSTMQKNILSPSKYHVSPEINGFSAPSKKSSETGAKRYKIQSQNKFATSEFDTRNNVHHNTEEMMDIKKRVKTQFYEKREEEYALQALKKSQNLVRDVFLPQISKGKQKLMTKMKQKVSYIKFVQHHINDSRQHSQRKELKRKLTEYQ